MNYETCYLQLFAEGISGDGNAADAGQPMAGDNLPRAEATQDAAAKSERLTWAQIMADPEYNREMQKVVSARLKAATGSARKQCVTDAVQSGDTAGGHSVTQPDSKSEGSDVGSARKQCVTDAVPAVTDAVSAVTDAVPAGDTDPVTQGQAAAADDRGDTDGATQRQSQNNQAREARLRRHYDDLVAQEANLREIFPDFSLQQALRDPVFVHLTAPHVGVSVENAFYLRNRQAHQAAAMQLAARKTAEKLSIAVRSGSHRPQENGTQSQAPGVAAFDYAHATAQQRQALKNAIRRSASRGEKLYPEEFC